MFEKELCCDTALESMLRMVFSFLAHQISANDESHWIFSEKTLQKVGTCGHGNFGHLSAVRIVVKVGLFDYPCLFLSILPVIASLCSAFLPVEQVGTQFVMALAVGWR